MRQKLFALGMLVVVLLFFGATVAVPTLQGLLVTASRDLPLGLDASAGSSARVSLAGGLVLLFAVLCLIYWRVPRGPIPWRCDLARRARRDASRWRVVDYAFPLYLSNVSSLRVGTSFVFILIVLDLVLRARPHPAGRRRGERAAVRTPEPDGLKPAAAGR